MSPATAIETEQVRLRLTENEDILRELEAHGRLKVNPRHPKRRKELVLLFDAKPFHFAPGETVIVGRRVANALRRESQIVVGDHLTGDVAAGVEEIGAYDMTQGYEEHRRSITACSICEKEFDNVSDLGKHLIKDHRSDRPDLYLDTEDGKNLDTRKKVKTEEGEIVRQNPDLLDA